VSKKTEKSIKPRKQKKNNRKNRKKKPIKILKKPASPVQFRFYKQKTEKTEPNPNRKKPEKNRAKLEKNEKTKPNRLEPVFVLKNRTELKPVGLNRFQFGFFFLNSVWLVFFYKNRIEPKMITPNRTWHACVGGDDGVPFRRKKRVQELVCCFHLCQLMLFKIIVVGPIMEWLA